MPLFITTESTCWQAKNVSIETESSSNLSETTKLKLFWFCVGFTNAIHIRIRRVSCHPNRSPRWNHTCFRAQVQVQQVLQGSES